MTSVGARLRAMVAVDPPRPLWTWYDDGNGERVELPGATLENWVAKTANLLVDGAGVTSGDETVTLLPPHWQTAAILLGCWTAGVSVRTEPAPAEVAFATPERSAELPQPSPYLSRLHPLALPLLDAPDAYLDYPAEVRGFSDPFVA